MATPAEGLTKACKERWEEENLLGLVNKKHFVRKPIMSLFMRKLWLALLALVVFGLTTPTAQAQTLRPGGQPHWGCFGYCPGPLPHPTPHYWTCYGYCPGPLPTPPYSFSGCYGYCPQPPHWGCFGYCPGPLPHP